MHERETGRNAPSLEPVPNLGAELTGSTAGLPRSKFLFEVCYRAWQSTKKPNNMSQKSKIRNAPLGSTWQTGLICEVMGANPGLHRLPSARDPHRLRKMLAPSPPDLGWNRNRL